jgi:tRNA pseudouridine32 synthase / 23S rRNA pseudouridine746 synthase
VELVSEVREAPAVYRARCRRCEGEHELVNRPALALAALRRLFRELEREAAWAEVRAALDAAGGKMVGVLLAEAKDGSRQLLRAFSGELGGTAAWPGFVGPVSRRQDTARLEQETLLQLRALTQQIEACDLTGAQRRLAELQAAVKAESAAGREEALGQRPTDEARAGGRARLEQARAEVSERERARRRLKRARQQLSAALMAAMFDATVLTNARGVPASLREAFLGGGIPSGTGECAVPKLLEAANRAGLRPVALAEAWWGRTLNGRQHGDVQPPCERKCQPILGYLLCPRGAP